MTNLRNNTFDILRPRQTKCHKIAARKEHVVRNAMLLTKSPCTLPAPITEAKWKHALPHLQTALGQR